MTTFKQCADIHDLRQSVNALDKEIIRLLGERVRFSCSAVRFKGGEEQIRNPEHMVEFLAQRRAWGEEYGVDTHVISDIYKIIVEDSISVQLKLWASRSA
jgi:isochorismate pyruvate lyase